MIPQRSITALAGAFLVFAWLASSDASAFGPRRVYVAPAPVYYSYPTYGYYSYPYPYFPNPYVAPLPGYSILPATNWGYGYYDYPNFNVIRTADDFRRDPLAPPPRVRSSLYPAVPFQASPETLATDRRRARFEVSLPFANAVVKVNGAATKQTGLNRVYVTPVLEDGKEYTVTISVQWPKQDGSLSAERQQSYSVKAGQTIQSKFVE